MHPGIFLALSGDQLFGLIIFGVVAVNVIRAILKAQKQQSEQQKERLRQPPPPRTQPGEKRAGREIEDFLEEISRGKGAPTPTAPRPAEQPQYRSQPPVSQPSPPRPVPPIAHPVPPTVPYPIERPRQQPRPQPTTMRPPEPQPQPQPRRHLEPQPETPRTVGVPPAPTSHPAGYKVATAPSPAPQPLRAKRDYALEVAESLEVTHAEKAESTALFDELLPEDALKRAIVLTELFGPCRAKKGAFRRVR